MSDYIKRSDAVKALRMIRNCVTQFLDNIESTADTLNALAMTADVRENVHGKWEDTDNGLFRCSICKKECLFMADKRFGKAYPYLSKYCAFCGAELEVVEDYGEEEDP